MQTVESRAPGPGSSRTEISERPPPAWRGPASRGLLTAATLILAGAVAAAVAVAQPAAGVQPAASNRVVIALANADNPSDLDYQGGECEINAAGTRMECGFQQVFLTIFPLDSATCLITTNQYARIFEKQSPTRWVSREGPKGECGLLDVATLEDEGNMIRWSMELQTVATNKALAACGRDQPPPEHLSWRNVRRPLPCRFVQPGAIRP